MCSTAAPEKTTTTRQTTSVNTVESSVPGRTEAPRATPSHRFARDRRWGPITLAVAVTALLTVGALLVPLPFVAISPGSVIDVGDLVESTEQPPGDVGGGFYLTTVRLTPVTTVEAVRAWLRPDIDVVDARRVGPSDLSPDELLQLNLDQMDASKRQALAVALEELGYDAVSGDGAEVVDVVSGAPADGLLVAGDLIVGLEGTGVTSHHDVLRLLAGQPPHHRIELDVEGAGGGDRRSVALTLAPGAEDPGQGQLGALLRTRAPRFDLPVDVDIATDRIGGPSAGLAFALEVLDVLSEGDLSGGRQVAATGTIELDGSVGQVGGVSQKAVAVEHEGLDLFLVPRAELPQATRMVGDEVRVEPVDTVADALRILTAGGASGLVRTPW